MLVKLFKSNNPLILLFLPFVGVILLFSSVIFSFSFDKTFTLVALLVIILFTAIYLNKGINKTILFNKPLYLTALCVTFFSCIDLTSVSYFPLVLANLFLSFGFLTLIKILTPNHNAPPQIVHGIFSKVIPHTQKIQMWPLILLMTFTDL